MKNKCDAGFSLIEVLVAIVILAAIVIPTCSSLVLSHKMNAKTEELMQAQLEVSSAVETLMAEGIKSTDIQNLAETGEPGYFVQDSRFSNVIIEVNNKANGCYHATFTSLRDGEVEVKTIIDANGVMNGEVRDATE